MWNNRNNWGGWQRYLGQDPGLPEAPTHAVASRRESLAGLPETLLTIGDLDLFYEECVTYAERLQSDGVACELFVTEGGCTVWKHCCRRPHRAGCTGTQCSLSWDESWI